MVNSAEFTHFRSVKITKHVVYWLVIILLLTLFFGQKGSNFQQAFFFATLLLPVAMGTTYFFIYYLIPRYLLQRRFLHFGLYFIYTVIIALYLEMLSAVGAFVLYANYQYADMNPLSTDVVTLGITILFIVFATAFGYLVIQYFQKEQALEQMVSEKQKTAQEFITIRSDRQSIPVNLSTLTHIESLSDYVKVHTLDQTYITKLKISQLEQSLPSYFVRIHRSFLVNTHLIASFTKEHVQMGHERLPISRTYKQRVLEVLMQD